VHQVAFEPGIEKVLRRFGKSVQMRILTRLKWLAEHFDATKAEGLTGEFAGLLKFRVGDYRIIYRVDSKKKIITVVAVGHRRSIYGKS
jgi:mRNA interferase RelE/StbE